MVTLRSKSEQVLVLKVTNFSRGIQVLLQSVREATATLSD